jgi:hypothetical protein
MNFAKRVFMFVGFVVLVAACLSVLAPKATHALVATLVQITNTSADPVPTYDSGTRFQADVCDANGSVSVAGSYCGLNTSQTFVVPTVTSSGATVKRLIVDNVSGICSSYNNPTQFIKAIFLQSGQFVPDAVPNGETAAFHYLPITGPAYSYVNGPSFGAVLNGVPETDYSYGQTTHFSFNPGDTVSLGYEFFGPNNSFDGACIARIEGMLATQ